VCHEETVQNRFQLISVGFTDSFIYYIIVKIQPIAWENKT